MSKKTVSSKKSKKALHVSLPEGSKLKVSVPMNSAFKKVPLKVLKKRGKQIYDRWYKKMHEPAPKESNEIFDGEYAGPLFPRFPIGRYPLEGDWIANLKEKLEEQGIRNGAFGIVRNVSFGLNPRQEISLRLEVMTGENQFEIFEFDYAKAESFIKSNKINDLEGIKRQPCLVCKMIDSKIVRMLAL